MGWTVGSFGRILKTETGGLTFVENKDENISAFNYQLFQNYPNPFNSSSNIYYSVPKHSQITLTVFDLLGREIKTIVNEYKPPGNYSVQFEANDLESGIYLYRLKTEKFFQFKKLLLVK